MVRKRKEFHFLHGGKDTPQFFCPECGKAHTRHSKIGKAHRKFSRF